MKATRGKTDLNPGNTTNVADPEVNPIIPRVITAAEADLAGKTTQVDTVTSRNRESDANTVKATRKKTDLNFGNTTNVEDAEVNPVIPRVITAAEADLAAKTTQVDMVTSHTRESGSPLMKFPNDMKTSVGLVSTDTDSNVHLVGICGRSPALNERTSGTAVSVTSLQRERYYQLGQSMPGAFDVPGVEGREHVAEDSSGDEEDVILETAAPPDSTGLAVAAPIKDHDDLEDARPVLPEDEEAKLEKKKETKFWTTIGALIAMAIVIFLIIFLVAGNNDDNNNKTNSTLSNDTGTPNQPSEVLTALLPAHTLPKILLNATPQGMAFEWVIQDPNFGSYSEKRLRQRFALATFYYSTNGEEWGPTWLNRSKHECQWEYFMPFGEQYDVLEGRYNELKFIDGPCVPVGVDVDNSTVATAASTLEHDDYLYLAFAQQPLTGEIPPEITMLTSLKMIQLDRTSLEGTIPTILAEFPGLLGFHLYGTSMTGTIPTELAKLTELRTLFISDGPGITGFLPTEIGLLSNLETLIIVETNVTGPIPIEYTVLDLYDFQMHSNFLNGTLPTQLGLWTRVDNMEIWDNALTGTIPSELGNMRSVWILDIADNLLTGTIPTELGQFEGITQLYLNRNKLTGTIPTELSRLSDSIWRLRLDHNDLTGTVPTELGRLSFCATLGIRNNMLNGTIPSEIAAMPGLDVLQGDGNQFSGSLPTEFFSNTMMSKYFLQDNSVSGSIPSEIGKWSEIENFNVEHNLLMTGTIPTEVGLLTTLATLLLGGNQFSGPLPSELGVLSSLAELTADSTKLTGTIPIEIGTLVMNGSLTLFNITDIPGLFGTIPDDVCGKNIDPGKGYVLDFDCGPLCGCDCPCNVSTSEVIVVIAKNDSIA